ncbi:MAG: class I SAM-dependent methyltransferase [Algicola sp.]|nr:class I SAM-dependent methyltransferase [Algicola sp.]
MKDDQASSTAYTVLQGILYIAKASPYKYLVEDEVVEVGQQILEGTEEGRNRLKQLNGPWLGLSVKFREWLILPGITLHYILRKRHVEDITAKAIEAGVSQVVMLGAGFDTLSWRFHKKYSDVNFIEIDHPATQKAKTVALDKNKGANMHFLSVDFAHQTLETELSNFAGFEAERKTLFICEGVMMYLSDEAVNILFKSIRDLSGVGTQFLYSALEPQKSAKNSIPGLLYHHLKFIGEPIDWDMDSGKMADYIKQHDCELKSLAGRDELLKSFVKDTSDIRLHSGEYFTLCEFK